MTQGARWGRASHFFGQVRVNCKLIKLFTRKKGPAKAVPLSFQNILISPLLIFWPIESTSIPNFHTFLCPCVYFSDLFAITLQGFWVWEETFQGLCAHRFITLFVFLRCVKKIIWFWLATILSLKNYLHCSRKETQTFPWFVCWYLQMYARLFEIPK